MVNKAVFLFPGQGAQYPGMALDFYDASARVRELFALASDIMATDMKKLIAESDAETLKRTDIAQPAVTLANLAAYAALAERGVAVAAAAGHSLGEYAALTAAGLISEADCLKLVKARGAAMHEAVSALGGSGMAAVMGLSPEKIESLIAEWKVDGLFAANFNSPRQTVVAGTAAALAQAEPRFKEAGARRFLPLKVAGPFHTPLMKAAADAFATAAAGVPFNNPRVPFFSNVTGAAVQSGEEAKKLAILQINSPVRWTSEEAEIAKLPPEALVEAGPGTVLAGLWKDTGSAIPCFAAGKLADFEKMLNA